MHVSIVIVTYRNSADAVRFLAALGASTYGDFEVCLVENGGPEFYEALAAATPAALPGGQRVVVHLAPENLGFAGGVNYGVRMSPAAEAWWILNPDTEPHDTALAAMMARLRRGDCGAVGCTLYRPDGSVQSYGGLWRSWLARPISLGYGRDLAASVDADWVEATQNYLNGASMLVGRPFVEAAGLMREDYFLYCEESEWFLREPARRLGLGFAPGALVRHAQGTTTGAGARVRSLPRLPIYLGERNKILLTRDRFPKRLPVAAVSAFLQLLARYARRGAWQQFWFGVTGWWAGLAGERGPMP